MMDDSAFYDYNYIHTRQELKAEISLYFIDDFEFDERQRDLFLNFKFKSLTDLDLSSLNIDDDFIKDLGESGNLRKIKNINLSKTNITKKTLKYLLNSSKVCCEGDIDTNMKYGQPIAEIHINTYNTSITKQDRFYYSQPKFNHVFTGYNGPVQSVKVLDLIY